MINLPGLGAAQRSFFMERATGQPATPSATLSNINSTPVFNTNPLPLATPTVGVRG